MPGVTNVGLYGGCLVDPSNNENVDWDRQPAATVAVITHGHDDHFWNAANVREARAKIYAPSFERSTIENPEINRNGHFCWAVPTRGMLPWYFSKSSCPVDGTLDELDAPLEVVPLPRHSQWQCGFVTPDGVLMAADAIVTKKAWDSKRIVYNTSPAAARQSLRAIAGSGADYVLPAHGELLDKDQAAELVGVNLEGIDMLKRVVLSALKK